MPELLTPRQLKEREYIPAVPFIKLMTKGVTSVLKTSAFHLGEVKKMRVLPEGPRYQRPPRQYDIPKFKEDMRRTVSDEKYLRSTRFCDPSDPRIVAMAHKLGAFQVSDLEFAKRAHELCKEKMIVEYVPLDSAGDTLERGTGTCFHLSGAMIALCRAAGIKARYKVFAMSMIAVWYQRMLGADSFMQKWYNSLGYFLIESEVQVFIDGKWLDAVVGPDAGWQAVMGNPISKLGETSLEDWFEAIPGTVMICESIPFGLPLLGTLMITLAPGSVERVSANVYKMSTNGKKIIEDAGGLEAYDAMVRAKRVKMPMVKMENTGQITFD
ncbi:MAG: transglutaminase family protein [Methanomassiliicoccales archaeon]|nr:transglutaminase family protein [Methanomassiliicoccales archaeon]